MAKRKSLAPASGGVSSDIPPYNPFWLYRFFNWIEHLPFPPWVLGALVIILGTLAMHLDAWRQGLVPVGGFNVDLMSASLFLAIIPALWLILNANTRIAINGFLENQPGTTYNKREFLADFLSVPSWLGAIIFVAGIIFGYNNYLAVQSYLPIFGQVLPPYSIFSFTAVGSLILLILVRSIRQGILIRRLYASVDVNIFNPTPIYSLSRFASQSNVVTLFIVYALTLINSSGIELLFDRNFLVIQTIMIGSVIFLFFVQLTSINKRMRSEKDRLLSEIGLNLDAVYKKINTSVRRERYAPVNELRASASALKEGWELVKRIPTWPWEPETLRNVLLPLLIPVVVYLLQRFAGGIFGL